VLGFLSQYILLRQLIDYTKDVVIEWREVRLAELQQPVEFTLGGVVGTHSIVLQGITANSISFTLFSDPIEVTLTIGETKKYDLNHDGRNDISFTLNDVKNGVADLRINRIEPPDPNRIYFLESRDYSMNLFAPAYLGKSEFNLTVRIIADIVAIDPVLAGFQTKKLIEYRTIIFRVQAVGVEKANISLAQAEKDIQEMEAAGFPTIKAREFLAKAQQAIEATDYDLAFRYTEEIAEMKRNAFEADSLIRAAEQAIADAKARGIDVPSSENSLALAKKAFEREDYKTAIQRAKETQVIVILETKGRINILRFLRTYWWQTSLAVIVAIIAGYIAYMRLQLFFIQLRLQNLAREETAIHSLIGEAQTKRFRQKKLSADEYDRLIDQYDKRLNAIKQIRIILRNKRSMIIATEKGLAALEREEKQIHDLMKNLQEEYLKKGTLSRERFLQRYEADKAKLAEIEEEKQALRERLYRQRVHLRLKKK
jgi:hypothetical protein